VTAPEERLKGRHVLVVGASRGIGRAIARSCVFAGARVALAARNVEKLDAVVEKCGESAIAVPCDVRDEQRCQAAVDETVERLGGLDAMVYAAGVSLFRDVGELTMDDLRTVFDTNVFGAAMMTGAALPYLEAAGGNVVYLTSESALYEPTPWRGIGAYIASKRALSSLVRSYQLEHPTVAFTDYVVGATETEFGGDDPLNEEALHTFIPEWCNRGYVASTLLKPRVHGDLIVELMTLPHQLVVDTIGARVRTP